MMKKVVELKEKRKKLVLKICTSTWHNASRDIRELKVVQELGADVIVMAKGETTGVWEVQNGFNVYRMSTRPLGNKMPKVINRVISLFIWASYAKKFNPDIISGHDLIPLLIGWMSGCFPRRKKRPVLVYDSHEFTIYAGKKSKVETLVVTVLERFLIKKCAFTIEVNDFIADEVQKIHHLSQRPIVVRNIPEKWEVDYDVCQTTRREIFQLFERKVENNFLLIYHGGVIPGRGIELLIKVVGINKNVFALILGDGEQSYIDSLKIMVEKESKGRIAFKNAVPYIELWKYVGAADVGMILAPAKCKNHLYSLPNKFFESIQSETPIVCPAYPAMEPIVEYYGFGLTCNPEDINAVNQCVEKMRGDRDFYMICKNNIKNAKNELHWKKECIVLIDAYQKILKI